MTASHTTRRFAIPAVVVAGILALFLSAPAAAAAVEQRSLDRAHTFLKDPAVGKDILSFVHLGAEYRRHQYTRTVNVNDSRGKQIPDQFALVYRYEWDEDGSTDVAFLCDWRGNVYKIQILKTNAIIQQPYAVADLTIKVLGEVVLGALGEKMSAEERAEVRKQIENADSRGMLLAYVKLAQRLR